MDPTPAAPPSPPTGPDFDAAVAGPPDNRTIALAGRLGPEAAHALRRLLWAEALRRSPRTAALALDLSGARCSAPGLLALAEGLRMLRRRPWRLRVLGLGPAEAELLPPAARS